MNLYQIFRIRRRPIVAYIFLFLVVVIVIKMQQHKPVIDRRIVLFPPALSKARQMHDFVEFVEFTKRNTTLTLDAVPEATGRILKQENCHLPDLVYPSVVTKEESELRVPKIVHLIWKSENIPAKAVPYIKRWEITNPDWEVWLWTDENINDYMKNNFPDHYDYFKVYGGEIEKADAVRYFILYQFGGAYADLDIEPVRSLSPLADKYTCLLSQEPYEHGNLMRVELLNNFGFLACNAFMMCRNNHPYFKLLVDSLRTSQPLTDLGVLYTTGPVFVSTAFTKYIESNAVDLCRNKANRVGIAPAEFFMPKYDALFNSSVVFTCSKLSALVFGMTYGQKLVCDDLYRRHFENKIFKVTFTDHHHFHMWAQGKELYFKNGFEFESSRIHSVLPKAVVKTFPAKSLLA